MDCDPKATANANVANNVIDGATAAGLDEFLRLYRFAEYEHAQTIEVKDGVYSLGEIETEGKPSSVKFSFTGNSVAVIHNHPGGTPHSVTDVLELAEACADARLKVRSMYVCTGEEVYAIVVEDLTQAVNFHNEHVDDALKKATLYTRHKSLVAEFVRKTPLGVEQSESTMYALAALLDKYQTGIRILRQDGDGTTQFKQKTVADESGRIFFQSCK